MLNYWYNYCRNFGFGVASCSARIAGMIAPFLVYVVSLSILSG